jgi:hypothetical protein
MRTAPIAEGQFLTAVVPYRLVETRNAFDHAYKIHFSGQITLTFDYSATLLQLHRLHNVVVSYDLNNKAWIS